jgi:hypothetical protein
MTTTDGIYSMKDMYTAVATQITSLQEPCNSCNGLNRTIATIGGNSVEITSETTYRPCNVCGGIGWLPTRSLQNIIMNVEYNFTLVLQHDMIGWMAKVTLDDEAKDWLDSERPVYGDPVTAVYAALYRAITKSSRSPTHKEALYTNLDASH